MPPIIRPSTNSSEMDKLTPEQRHRNMAAVHSTDTKPEIIVRRFLFAHGFRYRVNSCRLPGHPDIVLRKYRTCIFVNGCFWHGHDGCKYFRMPKSNTDFWETKINRNKKRDLKEQKQLAEMGWHSIIVWECGLKPKVREKTLLDLEFQLNRLFMEDHLIKQVKKTTYPTLPDDDNLSIAAEPDFNGKDT